MQRQDYEVGNSDCGYTLNMELVVYRVDRGLRWTSVRSRWSKRSEVATRRQVSSSSGNADWEKQAKQLTNAVATGMDNSRKYADMTLVEKFLIASKPYFA